ncbi:MAG: hypothetical protein F4043_09780 [Gammaproteobacteria bacterium]|nr:hypothetical protein [Gammaproteobacteria bacterium]MYC97795.1 hypothetical protein [Gammaproteobacteria bacterium]MYI22983.1 hypothetical protein [Gammaproteobacteria bacterium]
MTRSTRVPLQPGIATKENAMVKPNSKSPRSSVRMLSPSTTRRLLLRSMVAVSILAGTFAFTGNPAAAAASSCGDGDGSLCLSYKFCLFGLCISGKRYYIEEPLQLDDIDSCGKDSPCYV